MKKNHTVTSSLTFESHSLVSIIHLLCLHSSTVLITNHKSERDYNASNFICCNNNNNKCSLCTIHHGFHSLITYYYYPSSHIQNSFREERDIFRLWLLQKGRTGLHGNRALMPYVQQGTKRTNQVR